MRHCHRTTKGRAKGQVIRYAVEALPTTVPFFRACGGEDVMGRPIIGGIEKAARFSTREASFT